MAKRPELLIENGELAGRRFTVTDTGLRLGRSSSNDVHVPDEELSRSHCLFEPDGPDGIRVMDLASANGTFVNSVQLAAEPRGLKPGDIVTAGGLRICVVEEGEAPPSAAEPRAVAARKGAAVDLGLSSADAARAAEMAQPPPVRRSPLVNILWAVAVLSVTAAIVLVLLVPSGKNRRPKAPVAEADAAQADRLDSLYYEKVEADSSRIFRYQMTIDAAGTLRVVYDDVPSENRHVDKSSRLNEAALARIGEIFDNSGWDGLDEVYSGPSAADENALKSWRIRLVRGGKMKEVLVENVFEPESFIPIREALETFSRNELGIWAIQYSRDKLLELSTESEQIADGKWEEREVEYGNLASAVKAYKEAVFYLETVNPKPAAYPELKEKLRRAVAELDVRYRDQRFLADKAINLGDWERARDELRILCDLVPDKTDPRHAEANSKLVDVEARINNAKKGGKRK